MAKHKSSVSDTEKTNVMRILDQQHLTYTAHHYSAAVALSGTEAAQAMGLDANRVFKTLVCTSASGALYVFVIPAPDTLNLKRAARCVGDAAVKRAFAAHGICARRVFPHRHEKTTQNRVAHDRMGL